MRQESRNRSGVMLLYVMLILPVVFGVCALSVDFGYVEVNKFQLQQIADATAHDQMVLYASGSLATASSTQNTIFSLNGKIAHHYRDLGLLGLGCQGVQYEQFDRNLRPR